MKAGVVLMWLAAAILVVGSLRRLIWMLCQVQAGPGNVSTDGPMKETLMPVMAGAAIVPLAVIVWRGSIKTQMVAIGAASVGVLWLVNVGLEGLLVMTGERSGPVFGHVTPGSAAFIGTMASVCGLAVSILFVLPHSIKWAGKAWAIRIARERAKRGLPVTLPPRYWND